MDTRSSFGVPQPAAPIGFGGAIPSGTELPVNRMHASFAVEGANSIKRLTGLPRGIVITLYFLGAASLINSAMLLCPGGADIKCAAGDAAIVRSQGDGVWRVLSYLPANALPARGHLRVNSKTNVFLYGSFIRGADGWGTFMNTSEQFIYGWDPDSTNAMLMYFSRSRLQLNANSSGKTLFFGPSQQFSVDLTKRYKVGFTAYGYSSTDPVASQILVKCYDTGGSLLATLTVNVNVAITSDPIASQYQAIINAVGGSAPAFPTGTVTAHALIGFNSTGSQGLHFMSAYMIPEDEWPGSFSSSIVNYGGGTHDAATDGTYLYIIGHGCSEIAKFDGSFKKVASISVNDYPHCNAVVGTDLWVGCQDAATLQRISLSSFTVTNTYAIPGSRSGFGLGTDGTRLWLGAGTHAQGTAIYTVDTSTGSMTQLSTDVDTGGANVPVAYLSGSVWSIHESNSQVKRIDPFGGTTLATINCNLGNIYGLGAGGGYIFACGEKGVAQIDPVTNAVVNTYLFRMVGRGHSNVHVVNGKAYATGQMGVVAIDYMTGKFEELILDGGIPKWARSLPDGRVAVGFYAAPFMYLVEVA